MTQFLKANLFTIILYCGAIFGLAISLSKSKIKTKKALKKALKSFLNILPQFVTVILIIGISLSFLNKEAIGKLLGSESEYWGIIIAALIGSVTLIPGFVAFPLAAALLAAGAGYTQIAVFISALMIVGVVTFPVEKNYFGSKLALKRNILGLVYSIVCGLLLGSLMT